MDKIGSGRLQLIMDSFKLAGETGTRAFSNMSSSIMQTNMQLRQSHKILDEIALTFKNTVKWTATSSIVNRMADSIQAAWTFTKGLDTDLNDIRIVTGKSADEMERFAKQANKAAQDLGAATRDYTQASLIFYQQGLGDEEVNARTSVTLKAANVTGQQASEVSEQLTAVWNGYRVNAEETEAYVDKLAAVGANTASNLEELSTAMSKVASAANTAGVPIDNLNAILSTVISVTREAPETIGTAFKTIFARLGDLSLGGVDEEGISLGNVSSKLKTLGVDVLDVNGDMRQMSEIITDVAARWNTWTQAQKQAAAVAMAGKMQYSRLISLFENWNMYTSALETSQNALGTLQEQQDIYMESTAAHLQKLQTAWDRVFNSLVNNEGINGLVDTLTIAVNGIANFTEALGGMGNSLLLLGSIITRVFSTQIAKSINVSMQNITAEKKNIEDINKKIEAQEKLRTQARANGTNTQGIDLRIQQLEKLKNNIKLYSTEEVEDIMKVIDKYGLLAEQVDIVNQKIERGRKFLAAGYSATVPSDRTRNTYINSGKMSEQLKLSIGGDKAELTASIQSVNDFTKALTDYESKANRVSRTTEAALSKEKKLREQLVNIRNKAKNDWITYDNIPENVRKSIDQALQGIKRTDFSQLFDDKKLRNKVTNFLNVLHEGLEATKAEYENLEDIEKAGGGNRMVNEAKKERDDVGDTLQEKWDAVDTQKTTQSFVELASAVMSVTSALMTLSNIPNIWNDEKLSAGEKALQLTMALSSAIVQLGMSYITIASQGPIAADQIKKLAFAQLSQSAATTVGTSSNLKLATSFKILGGSAAKALLPLLPYIAVIAAIGTAIYGVVKAYNADADAAKESAIQTQKLKDAYQETKQAADNFKSTLNDYNSAVDNIRTLTAGTDEYKTAIIEANEKAIDLLKTNKDLAKYAYTDENGLISFTKEGRDKILQEQYEKVASAQINYLNSEINTLQKQLTSDWTNFARQRSKEQEQLNKKQQNDLQNYFNSINAPYLQKTSTATDAINQLQRNTKYSKNTELAAGVPRELVDAIAKYMKDNNFSDLSSSQLTNIDEFNNATKDIQDAITNNIDAYIKMANTINQSTQTQKLYAEQMTQAYLQMKGIIDDDGKLSVNEILATRIVEQQGGIDVSDEEILAKRNEVGEAAHWGRGKI